MLTQLEARSEIAGRTDYVSSDYYRTEQGESVPLMIGDQVTDIFFDMVHHEPGSITRLEWAVDKGIVTKVMVGEDGDFYFDMTPPEDVHKAADQLNCRIMAMMLAFPDRYTAVFGKDLPWDYHDPRFEEFLATSYANQSECISYDMYVAKTAPKRPQGRPRKEKKKEEGNNAHQNWLQACREHRERVSDAWNKYMQLCKDRKLKRREAVAWREAELTRIEGAYRARLQQLDDEVEQQFEAHAQAKSIPKPLKDDF